MRYGLTIALMLAWVGTGWGAGKEWEIKSMKGLVGVEVIIVSNSDAEKSGLHKSQLQTDVELRLRKAGIKVLRSDDKSSELKEGVLTRRVPPYLTV